MPSRTVIQLRQQVARRLRDHWYGTLTAAAAVDDLAVFDETRVEADYFFRNGYIHIGADATSEDHRIQENLAGVINFPDDGGIATVRAIGVAYEIHKLMSVPDYNALLLDAVLSAGDEIVLADIDSVATTITANAVKPGGVENEYNVPTGTKFISEVWLADAAGYYGQRIPNDQITPLSGAAGVKKLRFSEWATAQFTIGLTIRIIGQSAATAPALADTTAVYVDPDFLVSHMELAALIPISGGTGPRAQAARARVAALQILVEQKRNDAGMQHRVLPGSIVIPD